MAYIGNEAQTAFTSFDKQVLTGNGSTATFTLSHAVANEQEIEVFYQNVRQEGGSGKAYTVSGNQITFTQNIPNTETVYINFQGKALQTVVPPASSVNNSMITGMAASKLTGALPAIDGSALTGISTALSASTTIPSEGGAATTNIVQGLAKAWGKYNQTGTPAVNDSLNISGCSDNSAGNFTASFVSAMASANYVFPAISGEKHIQQTGTDATGSFTVFSSSAGNSAGDGVNYFAVHGDLA